MNIVWVEYVFKMRSSMNEEPVYFILNIAREIPRTCAACPRFM